MPTISERIESLIGGALSSVKNHDAKLFVKSAAFKDHPAPTIAVTAPTHGPSGSALDIDNTPLDKNRFPALDWVLSPTTTTTSTAQSPTASSKDIIDATPVIPTQRGGSIAQYLLVVEDPDAPLPSPIVHGIYYAISATKNSVKPEDFDTVNGASGQLQGGFRYGANRRKCVWSGPRPVLGHGVHRYMFQVVGLSEGLEGLSEVPTRLEIEKAIVGKVVGWGMWVGTYQRSLN